MATLHPCSADQLDAVPGPIRCTKKNDRLNRAHHNPKETAGNLKNASVHNHYL